MQQPLAGVVPTDFFVWVNPNDFMVRHNAGLVGSFSGGPLDQSSDGPESLLFIQNPNPRPSALSPFHLGVVSYYLVEHWLEQYRWANCRVLPSRLHALFLLPTRIEAERYASIHPEHVRERVLKRVRSVGGWKTSKHDASWIDFLRLRHSKDQETIDFCTQRYWDGARAEDAKFISCGTPWKAESATEVLFYGRVDFVNRDLKRSDE
jgi:hypothetical protein